MSDQQDFEKLSGKLSAIDRKAVRFPDMPVVQAVKKGELMATAAAEDSTTLTAVGVVAPEIEDLGASVGALRFTEARLTAALGELKEAGKQWVAEEPAAYTLRADLLAAESYALRNIPDAKKAIKRIREGTGNPDMIQDLLALSELGKKYPQQMKAVNFDLKILDTAAQKSDLLGRLYAKAFMEKSTKGAKDMRDRAFTYMRTLMGEILDAAEYAFRNNKARLDYYYSTYRSRSGGATVEPGPAPSPAPTN
jgi:type IV secretory pathway VirJ component